MEKQVKEMLRIHQVHDEHGGLFYQAHCYCGWQVQTDTMKQAWDYCRHHLLIGGIRGLFQQGNRQSHPVLKEGERERSDG